MSVGGGKWSLEVEFGQLTCNFLAEVAFIPQVRKVRSLHATLPTRSLA